MNKAFFTDIRIENFKSLRSVELKGCNRINVFIGKPNVGKSNILEALSLFALANEPKPFDLPLFKKLVRVDNETELFFDGEDTNAIKMQSNLYDFELIYDFLEGFLRLKSSLSDVSDFKNSIKKYVFKPTDIHLIADEHSNGALRFPFGDNLVNLNARQELAVFIVHWKDGETLITKLTDEQLEDVYQYGVDLFTNVENYF